MSDILNGMMSVCTPTALLLMLGGVILGIAFGALPGLSATTGIALCLPMHCNLWRKLQQTQIHTGSESTAPVKMRVNTYLQPYHENTHRNGCWKEI